MKALPLTREYPPHVYGGAGVVVWIPEMLPVPEVIQLYSHAAVFVCPSVCEPFGVINLRRWPAKRR